MNNPMSLRNQVIQTIKTKIQHNELHPNQMLTESKLCDELNISRTPVREALIQLVADGILKKVPRKGYAVNEFDDRAKLNLYSIIATLDALAATSASEHLTENDYLKMNECADKMDIAIKYKNYVEYYTLQDEFHAIYVQKCDNPRLIDLIKDLSSGPLHRSYISNDTDRLFEALQEANDEHRTIIELFKNKKDDELEKFLRKVHWATKYPGMI